MDEHILGKKRREELKELILKGKMSPENALRKVWPRKKVEPIDNAWDYLVRERMIVFSDEYKMDYKEQQKEYKQPC